MSPGDIGFDINCGMRLVTTNLSYEERGIYVPSVSYSGLAEEAGPVDKDLDEVVDAAEQAGISKRVVRLIPIGNVKG